MSTIGEVSNNIFLLSALIFSIIFFSEDTASSLFHSMYICSSPHLLSYLIIFFRYVGANTSTYSISSSLLSNTLNLRSHTQSSRELSSYIIQKIQAIRMEYHSSSLLTAFRPAISIFTIFFSIFLLEVKKLPIAEESMLCMFFVLLL